MDIPQTNYSVPLCENLDLDTFASYLADVYRGLIRIGWDRKTATEFVDMLNEDRYQCIKLRKEVAALKKAISDLR